MNTLCVLLPVYNAHETLEPNVTDILEVLPELSERFQITILDDGSTDDTVDVATDLAARYPQVRLIRHPVRLGLAESIQTALDNVRAEQLLISDEDYNLEPDDLRVLWQLRELSRPTVERPASRGTRQNPRNVLAWKPLRSGGRGFQIIDRKAFEHLRLRQSLDAIARIDRAGSHSAALASALRPKYLGRPQRFSSHE